MTGAELVERCRAVDPDTIPSTVYRTLDVLEELGVISHSHGADGREEFHVLPAEEHGHLYCRRCGGQWELAADDPAVVGVAARPSTGARGFEIDVSHLTLIGRCATCRADGRRADRLTAMAILPIVQLGDPVLRMPTVPVTRFDRTLGHLLDDMTETMRDAPGVGLAANQVGRTERVCVIEIKGRHIELVNPVLVRVDGTQTDLEGCLSLAGFYAPTTRADHAVVTGLDRRGRPVRVAGRGLPGPGPAARAGPPRWARLHRPPRDRSTTCSASATTASDVGEAGSLRSHPARPVRAERPSAAGRPPAAWYGRRTTGVATPASQDVLTSLSVATVELFYGLLALVAWLVIVVLVAAFWPSVATAPRRLARSPRRSPRTPSAWPGSWPCWRRPAACTSPRSRASSRARCAGTSGSRCTRWSWSWPSLRLGASGRVRSMPRSLAAIGAVIAAYHVGARVDPRAGHRRLRPRQPVHADLVPRVRLRQPARRWPSRRSCSS